MRLQVPRVCGCDTCGKNDSGGLELEFDLVPQGFGLFAVVAESEDRNSAELGPVD